MQWFYNLKIATKLTLGFSLVALLAGVVGYVGVINIRALDDSDAELYQKMTVPISQLASIDNRFQRIRVNTRDGLLANTPAEIQVFVDKVAAYRKEIDDTSAMYEKTILSDEMRQAFIEFKAARVDYGSHLEEWQADARGNKDREGYALLEGGMKKSARREQEAIQKMIDMKVHHASIKSDDNGAKADAASTSMISLLALGVAVALSLGIFLARIISRPLNDVVVNINNADLNSRFNSQRKDELGDLQRAFDRFIHSIKETLLQVSEASSAVASSSSEISSSTEQMAAGAQEQTSQAGEVASAVEEMTKTIVENSRNASETAGTAKEAKKAAEDGGLVVEETVLGMKRIADVVRQSALTVQELGKSSDQIGEIIGVIDDIADQTNLLALNAAIEAARAGDQGRGFAVVADEVRKLAERTSKATKEIATMIKKIQTDTRGAVTSMDEGTRQVDDGIKLADKAGASLHTIVGISQRVTDMVSQIAAASEQQSTASEQISKNVEAISSVTNESAAGVQQIARAAEDLNRLTEKLQHLLAQFKLGSAAESDDGGRLAESQKYNTPKSSLAVRANGALVRHEQQGSETHR